MGPGINTRAGFHRDLRIAAVQYFVQKHDGAHHKTVDYSPVANGQAPRLGCGSGARAQRWVRTTILMHCAYPELAAEATEPPRDLWLSSVGCINLMPSGNGSLGGR